MVSLFDSWVGDLIPRESIAGDGSRVDLGIRRCPWWSDIIRDT